MLEWGISIQKGIYLPQFLQEYAQLSMCNLIKTYEKEAIATGRNRDWQLQLLPVT